MLGIYADYYIFETTLKEQADEEETVGECQHAGHARTCSWEIKACIGMTFQCPRSTLNHICGVCNSLSSTKGGGVK